MANTTFNKGKYRILEQYLNGGSPKTLKVMFMDPSYTVDIDAHHYVSDISASRASGSTDQTLANLSLVEDDTNDQATADYDDVSVADETIVGGTNQVVVYESTGSDATSPLLFKFDIKVDGTQTTITPIAGTLALTLNASGLFGLS